MKKIVGIRFKSAGKVYDFDSGAFVLNRNDYVIVETERGLSMGTVAIPPVKYDDPPSDRLLKKVFRIATEKDFKQKKQNLEIEKNAFVFCRKCIKQLELKMNLFAVESAFDASKLTFFFTAEDRVDFRQLVKMVVKRLNVRIEMRQVGIRNQAKICGGVGRCGRNICCSTFMEKFAPVSIRMAKEQNLSLNPTKISGQCGRLMCCLTFENETYKALKEKFPRINEIIDSKHGKGRVLYRDVVNDRLTIKLDNGQKVEIPFDSIE